MSCTACTEPQCLYKGDLYLTLYLLHSGTLDSLPFRSLTDFTHISHLVNI